MHRNDPVRDPFEKLDRIIPCDVGIARIVVHSKVRMLDCIYQRTKDVHLLGELWILPEVIFVMVLDDERDTSLFGIRQTL